MRPVKALGDRPNLRVAEIESTGEGVGPERQPAQQIGRSFHNHQLPRWPGEIEAELAAVEAKDRTRAKYPGGRVSLSDCAAVRHINASFAVHRDSVSEKKTSSAARPVRTGE